MKNLKALIIIMFFSCITGGLYGVNYTWTAGSGNWNNAANWGGAGVPGAGDTATISGAVTVTLDLASVTVDGVTLTDGTTVLATGGNTLSSTAVSGSGKITSSGGNLTINNGSVNVSGTVGTLDLQTATALITVTSPDSLTATNSQGSGEVIGASNSTLSLGTVAGTSFGASGALTSLTITSGEVQVKTGKTLTTNGITGGTINGSGGSLTIAAGAAAAIKGTFATLNNTVQVNTGANALTVTTASGAGVVNVTGGDVTLNTGTIKIKGTVGTLDLQTGTAIAEVTGADSLTVTSTLGSGTISGLINANINVGTVTGTTTKVKGAIGTLTIGGGELLLNTGDTLSATSVAGTGTLNGGGGSLTVAGGAAFNAKGSFNTLANSVQMDSGANAFSVTTASGIGLVTSTGGDLTVSGGTLVFSGTAANLTLGGTLQTGANALNVTGTASGAGKITSTGGNLTIADGSTNVSGTVATMDLTAATAALTVTAADTLTATNTQGSGEIIAAGSADVNLGTVAGTTFQVSGAYGTLTLSGEVVVPSGKTVSITTLAGTVTFSGAGGSLTVAGGVTFTGKGSFNTLNNSVQMDTLLNALTVTTASGSGLVTSTGGNLTVSSGTMLFSGTVGNLTLGGTLQTDGNALNVTGTASGAGKITSTGGNLTIADGSTNISGTVATMDLTAGTAALTVTAADTLTVTNTQGAGEIIAAGSADVNLGTVAGTTFQVSGTFGTLTATGEIVVPSGKTTSVTTLAGTVTFSGAGGSLVVAGGVTFTGKGTFNTLNNSVQMDTLANNLIVTTASGSAVVTSTGGNLSLNTGTMVFSGTTGDANLVTAGAELSVTAPASLTTTTSQGAGIVTAAASPAIDMGTVSGTSLRIRGTASSVTLAGGEIQISTGDTLTTPSVLGSGLLSGSGGSLVVSAGAAFTGKGSFNTLNNSVQMNTLLNALTVTTASGTGLVTSTGGNLTVSGGTMLFSGTAASLTLGGTLQTDGNALNITGTASGAGKITSTGGNLTIADGSTNISGTVATLDLTAATAALTVTAADTLTAANTQGAGEVIAAGSADVNLGTVAGTTFQVSGTYGTLTFSGEVVVPSGKTTSVTTLAGTATFNGAGGSLTVAGGVTFTGKGSFNTLNNSVQMDTLLNALTVTTASGSGLVTSAGGNLTVSGGTMLFSGTAANLTLGGTLQTDGNALNVTGTASGAGKITSTGGNLTIADGSSNFNGTVATLDLTAATAVLTVTAADSLTAANTQGAGEIIAAGSADVNPGTVAGTSFQVSGTYGTLTLTGEVVVPSGKTASVTTLAGTAVFSSSGGSLTIAGGAAFTGKGTFVTLNNSVQMDTLLNALTVTTASGSGLVTSTGGNLSVSGGTMLFSGTVANLVLGGTLQTDGNALTVTGTLSGAGKITSTGGNLTIADGSSNFNGTVATLDLTAATAVLSVTAADSLTATNTQGGGEVIAAGSADVNLGSVAGTTFQVSGVFGTFTATGELVVPSGKTVNITTLAGSAIFSGSGGSLIVAGGAAFTGKGTFATLNNSVQMNTLTNALTVTTAAGSAVVTSTGGALTVNGGTMIVSGDFTTIAVGAGAVVNTATNTVNITGNLTGAGEVQAGANTITVGGNWSITTFTPDGTPANGRVILSGAASINSAAAQTFNTLELTGAVTLAQNIVIKADLLDTGAGSLNAVSFTITADGTFSVDDFIHGTSTVQINSTQTLAGTTDHYFYNLNVATGFTLTPGAHLTVYGVLAIQNGNVDFINTHTLELYGGTLGTGSLLNYPGGTVILKIAANTITTANNVISGGTYDIEFLNALVLNSDLTVTTTGNVTFLGTVDGPNCLKVTAGGVKTVTFNDNVGAGTAIGNASDIFTTNSLEVSAGTIEFKKNLTTGNVHTTSVLTGAINFTDAAGSTVTSGAGFQFSGAVTPTLTFSVTTAGTLLIDNSITATNQNITLNSSTTGNLTIADGAVIDAGSGLISVSGNVVTLGSLKTTSTAANAITVNTNSNLADGGDTHVDLDAASGTAVLNINTGTAAPLEMNVAKVNFTTTGAGNVDLTQTTQALEADGTAVNGSVTLSVTGFNLTLGTLSAGGAGNLTLSTITSGNIILNALSAAGSVNLTSAGSITERTALDGAADITGASMDLLAASGIGTATASEELEVSVSTITRANTTTGGVYLKSLLGTNVTGTEIRSTTSGDISVLHTGASQFSITSVTTASGLISVNNTGGNVTISNATATGTITLTAAGTLTSPTATTTGGTITLSATGGDINATTVSAGGAGSDVVITTTTSGNVNAGSVTAVDRIDITSAGAVTELTALDGTAEFTAPILNILAVTGVGTAAAGEEIEIDSATVERINTGTGGVFVKSLSASAVTVTETRATTSGNVSLIHTGNVLLTVTAAEAVSGTLTLSSTANALTLTGGNSSGAMSLTAGNGALTITSAVTTGGAITAGATSGNLDAGTLTAGGAFDMTLSTTTSGNIILGNVDATGNRVTLTSAGSIQEKAATDGAADVTASVVSFTASSGIGTAAAGEELEVDAATFELVTTATGGLYIRSVGTGAAVLTTATATTSGDIVFVHDAATNFTVDTVNSASGNLSFTVSAGTFVDNNAGVAGTTFTGSGLTLITTGALGTVSTFSALTAATAGVPLKVSVSSLTSLSASGSINIENSGGALTFASGAVNLSGTGDVVIESASLTLSAADSIVLTGSDNLSLIASGTITLHDGGLSTGGNLRLRGIADIVDGGASPRTLSLTANGLNFYSGGASQTLTTSVTILTAEKTQASAALTVTESNGLSTDIITTNGGNVSLTTSAGNLIIGNITASGALVTLNSAGNITELAATDGAAEITSGTVDLLAVTGIGTATAGEEIEISSPSWTKADTTTGGVYVKSLLASPVTVTQTRAVTSGNINVQHTGGALLTLTTVTAASGAVTLASTVDALTVGTLSASGNVNLSSAGNMIVSTSAESTGGTLNATVTAGTLTGGTINSSGNMILSSPGNMNVPSVTVSAGTLSGTVSGGTFTGGTLSASGNVSLSSSGVMTLTSVTSTGGTLTAGATGAALSAGTLSSSGTMTLTSSGTLDVTTGTTTAGALSATATGGTLTAGTLTAGGAFDLTLTTVTSGNIIVDNLTAAGDRVVLNSAGNIQEKAATDGAADLTAAAVNLLAASGIGTATAGEELETDTVLIERANTTTGGVYIRSLSTGAVSVTETRAVTSGDIIWVHTGNSLMTMSAVQAVLGAVTLTSTLNSLVLDSVSASGTVTATAEGSINDVSGVDDITAPTVVLTAKTGIGSGAALDLKESVSITADNNGTGNIVLLNNTASAANLLLVDTTSGTVSYTQTGTAITTVSELRSGNGNITLINSSTGGSIGLSGAGVNEVLADSVDDIVTITSSGGNIYALADDVDREITASAVVLSAPNGTIGIGSRVDIDADDRFSADTSGGTAGGHITLTDSVGNLVIDDISSDGTVTLIASAGSLVDLDGGTDNDITAQVLSVQAAGGFGTVTDFTGTTSVLAGTPLRVAVSTLSQLTHTGTNGDINLLSSQALNVADGAISAGGAADIVISAPQITLAGSASVNFTGGDNLSLITSGTVSLDTAGLTTTGNLRIRGLTDVVDSGGTPSILDLTSNTLDFTSGGASVTLNTAIADLTAVLTQASAALTVTESNALTLTSVTTNGGGITVSNTAGDLTLGALSGSAVSLTSAGAILEKAATDAGAEVTATVSASLQAQSGIGTAAAGEEIELDTPLISLMNSVTGGVYGKSLAGSSVTVTESRGTVSGDIVWVHSGASLITYNTLQAVSGNINLSATAGGTTVTTASSSGTFTAAASGALTISSGTTTTGTITGSATGGNLTAVSLSAGGAGDINLTTLTSGNIIAGNLQAVGDRILLASVGNITEYAPLDGTAELTSANVHITAATGVGTAAAGEELEIDAVTLEQVNTSSGGVYLLSLSGSAVTITDSRSTVSGDIVITHSGASLLTLNNVLSSGFLTVNNTGGAVSAATLSSAGNMTLTSSGALTITTGTTTGGTIAATATGGTLTAGTLTAGGAGDINLTTVTSGSIVIGSLTAAGDRVALTSVGSISEQTALDGSAEITSANVSLSAVSGIGSGTLNEEIEVDAVTVEQANSTTGGVYIKSLSTSAVTVTETRAITSGNLSFIQTGAASLTVTTAVTASGSMTVQNSGGALSAGTLTSSGTLTLSSAGTLDIVSGSTTSGAVTASAAGGTLTAGTLTAGGIADISLTTTGSGDIVVDNITASGDKITLTSAGSILEKTATDAGADLTAATLDLLAVTGAGTGTAGEELETDIATLDRANTTTGGIYIKSLSASPVLVTESRAVTSGDIVILHSSNSLFQIRTAVTASGNISVNSQLNSLAIDVMNASGSVTLNSAGYIEDWDSVLTEDITAPTVSLTAVSAIGATGRIGLKNTASLTVFNNGAGHVVLNNNSTSPVSVLRLETVSGNLDYIQTGGTSFTGYEIRTGNGNITINNTAGDIILSSAGAGEVTADLTDDVVTLTSGTGNIAAAQDNTDIEITGSNIVLNAVNGTIGTSFRLDIDADDNFTALTNGGTASGHITVTDRVGNFPIDDISSDGTVSIIAAAGSLIDVGAGTDDDITAVTLYLEAESGIGTVTDFTALTAASAGIPFRIAVSNLGGVTLRGNNGDINILSSLDLTLNNSAVTAAGAADMVFSAPNLTLGGSASVDFSGGDNLSLITAGTLTLHDSGLNTSGNLRLRGVADIIDSGASPRTLELTGTDLNLYGGGASRTLNTVISSLTAEHTQTASGLTVRESDSLNVDSLLTVNGDVDISNSGGDIQITSLNSGTALTKINSNGFIRDTSTLAPAITAGDLKLTAGGDINKNLNPFTLAVSRITAVSSSGSISLSEQDSFTVDTIDSQSGISAGAAAQSVNIVTGQNCVFNAPVTAGNLMTLQSVNGSFSETTTAETVLLTAGTLNIQALNGGVGGVSPLDLEVTVNSISGITAQNDIYINSLALNNVSVTSLRSQTSGNISFVQTGDRNLTLGSAITASGSINADVTNGDITASTVTAGGSGNISFTTQTAGHITLGEWVALAGRTDVVSAGALYEEGSDAGAEISSPNVNILAVSGIGTSAAGGELEINSTALERVNTTTGGVYIYSDSSFPVTVSEIRSVTSGDISLVHARSGLLTITELEAAGGSASVTTTLSSLLFDIMRASTSLTLSVEGWIRDADAPLSQDIFTPVLTASAKEGIGTSTESIGLDEVLTLSLVNSGTGDIRAENSQTTGSVSISQMNTITGGVYYRQTGTFGTTVQEAATDNGNITIQTSGSLSLGQSVSGAIRADLTDDIITLTSDNGNIDSLTEAGLEISGATVNLSAPAGSIGAVNPLDINGVVAVNAAAVSGGIIYMDDETGDFPAENLSVSGGTLHITSVGNITRVSSGVITAGTLLMYAPAGNIGALTVNCDYLESESLGDVTITELDSLTIGAGTLSPFDYTGVKINDNGSFSLTTSGGNLTIIENVLLAKDGTLTLDALTAEIRLDASLTVETLTDGSGDIHLKSDTVIVSDNKSVISEGSSGNIRFYSTLNGPGAFTVRSGTGNVDIDGLTGGITPLNIFTITGNRVNLNGVGTALSPGVINDMTVETPLDRGVIYLLGENYNTGGDQLFQSGSPGGIFAEIPGNMNFISGGIMEYKGSGHTVFYGSGAGDVVIQTAGGFSFNDLLISLDGKTITVQSALTVKNLELYHGTVDLQGNSVTVAEDAVFLGAGYSIDDPDTGVTGLFAYDHPGRQKPVLSDFHKGNLSVSVTDPPATLFSTVFNIAEPYSGLFADLDGAVFNIAGNFYNNGCNMPALSLWTLNIPVNDDATVAFAEAYNMSVANSSVPDYTSANDPSASVAAAENVTVTSSDGWNNNRPRLDTSGGAAHIETVYDNVIKITLEGGRFFENSNNEISAAAASGLIGVTDLDLRGGSLSTYTDSECTLSTDSAGDLAVFYIKVEDLPGNRWNTDATGTSSGAAASTDRGRSGVPPAHRSVIPYISIDKSTASVYFSLRDKDKNRIEHRPYGINPVTNVLDGTSPVLITVEAGRDIAPYGDSVTGAMPYSGHNYFNLTYSEAVNFSTGAGAVTLDNIRSSAAPWTTDASSFLGHMYMNGGNTDVIVDGLFSYPGYFESGTFDGDDKVNSIYYTSSSNSIRVYAAGYSESDVSGRRIWPGYLGDPSRHIDNYNKMTAPGVDLPVHFPDLSDLRSKHLDNAHLQIQLTTDAEKVTVPFNSDITDSAGNVIDGTASVYASGYDTLYITGGNWDVYPPFIARYTDEEGTQSPAYEVLSQDLEVSASGLVDTMDFHVLDDFVLSQYWNSIYGWQLAGRSEVDTRPDNIGGLRDTSFIANKDAFLFRSDEDLTTVNIYNVLVDSTVRNQRLNEGSTPDLAKISVQNDGYFTVQLKNDTHTWKLRNQMFLVYDAPTGRITDHAGNLMPSSNGEVEAFQWIEPRIVLTLAEVGNPVVYVQFSKKVFGRQTVLGVEGLQPDSFDLTGTASNIIESVVSLGDDPLDTKGKSEFYFILKDPLTADEALSMKLVPRFESVYDTYGAVMTVTNIHRITDLGVGVVAPLWAADSVHREDAMVPGEGALKVLDGTGSLMPEDISIRARITGSANNLKPLKLIYDIDVPPSSFADPEAGDNVDQDKLWLPEKMARVTLLPNRDARLTSPVQSDDNDRIFFLEDEEFELGKTLEFYFKLGDLYCVNLPESASLLRDLEPWSFSFKDVKRQKGGVTILNNVINPLNNEKTKLLFNQARSGLVTINVFALDGSLVKVIDRGRRSKGNYTFEWDGRNESGQACARGVYFIRVVAPGVDEMRKVMIIK